MSLLDRLSVPILSKVVAAVLLSVLAVGTLAMSGDTERRAQTYSAVDRYAQQEGLLGDRVVSTALTTVNLQEAESKTPFESIDYLRESISPLNTPGDGTPGTGAFYSLMEMLKQLAGVMIIPLLVLGLGAILLGRGEAVSLGAGLLVVLGALWFFPMFGALMEHVTDPMTKHMVSSERMEEISESIDNDQGSSYLGSEDSPLAGMMRLSSKAKECAAKFHQRGAEGDSDVEIPAYCTEDRAVFNETKKYIAARQERSREQQEAQAQCNPGLVEGADMADCFAMLQDQIQETVWGWIAQIVDFLWTVFFWTLLLGVEFGKAMIFVFAPLALVSGLFQTIGSSEVTIPSNVKGWFNGATLLYFLAPGIALVILVFWAFASSVYMFEAEISTASTGALMTSMAGSIGVKAALWLVLLFFVFNFGKFIKLMTGQATEVAFDMATAVQRKAVSSAKGTLKAGAMAAGGAVAGPAGAQAAGSLADKAAQPLEGLGNAANSLSERFGGGGGFDTSAIDRGASHAGDAAMAGATTAAVGGSGEQAAEAATQKLFSPMIDDINRFQDEVDRHREQVHGPDQQERAKVSEHLADMEKSREEMTGERDRFGIERPSRRPGESLGVDAEEIDELHQAANAGSKPAEIGQVVADHLVMQGDARVEMHSSRDEDGNIHYDLNDEAVSGINELLTEDGEFRDTVIEHANELFGGGYAPEGTFRHKMGIESEVPLTRGPDGQQIPDIQAMLERSDEFAKAMQKVSAVSLDVENALHQREGISALSQMVAENSAFERAVRELDNDLTLPEQDESVGEYQQRVQNHGDRLLHLAHIINQQGLSDAREQLSDVHSQRGGQVAHEFVETQNLDQPDSIEQTDPSYRRALQQAIQLEKSLAEDISSRRVVHGGAEYGIDVRRFRQEGVIEYKAQGDSAFENAQQEHPDLDTDELYQQVKQEIRSELAQQFDQFDSQDDVPDQVIHEHMFLTNPPIPHSSSSRS